MDNVTDGYEDLDPESWDVLTISQCYAQASTCRQEVAGSGSHKDPSRGHGIFSRRT